MNKCEFAVWVNAISPATRVVLKANRLVVESVSWLCPANNVQHINLAVLKGVNLVLKWQAKVLHTWTDSVCIYQWTLDALKGKARLTAKAASEMLL